MDRGRLDDALASGRGREVHRLIERYTPSRVPDDVRRRSPQRMQAETKRWAWTACRSGRHEVAPRVVGRRVDALAGGVLRLQGIRPRPRLPSRIDSLLHRALEVYRDLADPRAVVELTTGDAFGTSIAERAATPQTRRSNTSRQGRRPGALRRHGGARVTTAIARLFARHDLALAADARSVSSEAADGLARTGGQTWLAIMQGSELVGTDARVLAYSPATALARDRAARALFQVLDPRRSRDAERELPDAAAQVVSA